MLILGSVLSFILLVVTLPPLSYELVALVALVPLFFVWEKARGLPAFIATSIVGTAYFFLLLSPLLTLNSWWWTPDNNFLWQYQKLIIFITVCALSLCCAAVPFIASTWYFKKFREQPYALLLLFPLLWGIAELVRVHIMFGFKWATFGWFLIDTPFSRIAADVFGSYALFALSAFVVYVNIFVFMCLRSLISKKIPEKKQLVACGVALAILLTIYTLHVGEKTKENMATEHNTGRTADTVDVAIIHSTLRTENSFGEQAFEYYRKLLNTALSAGVDLVVLPENTLPFLVLDEKNWKPELSSAVPFLDNLLLSSKKWPETSILIGLHTKNGSKRHNSLILIERGAIVGLYTKKHLIPFAEKSPDFLKKGHVEPLSGGEALAGGAFLETLHGNITPYICSEAIVRANWTSSNKKTPETGREEPKFPDFLVNISNDSIFSSPYVALYNEKLIKMLALEQGRPLVRSAKGGFSGIFSSAGEKVDAQKKISGDDAGGYVLFGSLSL